MGGFPQSEPVHVTTTQLKKQNFPAPQEIPCVPPPPRENTVPTLDARGEFCLPFTVCTGGVSWDVLFRGWISFFNMSFMRLSVFGMS